MVDVRHEATAVRGEGGQGQANARGARRTAGAGATNAVRALAAAQPKNSPMVVLAAGRAAWRWGQGSLQEIDHLPLVRPVTKLAATAGSPAEIPGLVDAALAAALAPPSGPVFVDFPLDHVFMEAVEPPPTVAPDAGPPAGPDGEALERAVGLLREAERPVVMAGTNLYWGHGEEALARLVEELRIPVFLNGLGRGCLAADHELFFSRTRRRALGEADVALVIGVPMDFRLGFGAVFGAETEIVVIDRTEEVRAHPRRVAAALHGPLAGTLGELTGCGTGRSHQRWIGELRVAETAAREGERAELEDDRAPLHPMRIYGELGRLLERNAIVVGDGGDFVSYAGRLIESYEPGCWLDSGPFGCLGSGLGYALAAKLARPDRQVVLLVGDGAFGFAGMELDTLARHGVGVVVVVGNNGIWGLEKHPMEWLYGYSVAADLRPGTATTWWPRRSAATASWSSVRPSCARPSSGRSGRGGRPWSTC